MTDIEKLESELNRLTIAKAKAETVVEQIETSWQQDYETTDLEEIKTIRDNLGDKIKKATAQREEKLSEAAKLLGIT